MIDFNENFFINHQKTLLFVANKWYLSWLLGFNRLPEQLKGKRVDKITPNSIHHFVGKPFTKKGKFRQRIVAEFFTRPLFAEALAYNLSPVAFLGNSISTRNWQFSPVGLIYACFLGIISYHVTGIPFGFLGTTTSYNCGAGDGYCSAYSTTWALTRARSASNSASYVSYTSTKQACYTTTNELCRLYFPSLTSGIGAGSTVESGTMNYYYEGQSWSLGSNKCDFALVGTSQASNTSLTTTDYPLMGTTRYCDTDVLHTSDAGWKAMTLNSAGISAVSKTSYTKFGLRPSNDFSDSTAPDNYSGGYIRFSEYSGYVPYLSITYSTAAPTNASFLLNII